MKAIIFDLDNTLYSPERQLFNLIDVRINAYMRDVAGIPHQEVDGLRRTYWQKYGVTLQGLIRHHGVDPEDYLHYVHDVDVRSRLVPDPELRQVLEEIPQRKVIFTNGSRCHVDRVLAALELEGMFDEIFDIRVAGYLPKPFPEPYQQVLNALQEHPADCLMVEDSLANLQTAKRMGMRTLLVGATVDDGHVDHCVSRVAQVVEALP